ncbi:hypothetical protein QEV83_15970 [Methylocapsa sp. D3K7]|uniref:hypothetical protein n=1 Tax=Methylocapsa sp. D3K7 TaxID=3041435 RepID=UPI00244EFFDD|nr:hypothetical protein [Methylocapsa sp. D3K7]WGJ14132.1 hypothetical protein QEV83_15970 [Methylocapsa sp. D3K7]
MKYPFSDATTKIRRAQKHLAELETEAAAFIASNPARFTVELAEARGGIEFNFTLNVEAAPEWLGAIIGDVIHNLRTALDLTACEIVRAADENDEDVYFPFSKSADELEHMIKKRKFNRAGTDAVALLVSMKPHHNGNAALRAIHDLDIQDKHRALIPNAITTASPVIQMWEDDGRINPRVIGDPNAPTEIKLIFPNEVGLAGREIIPTLHELVQLVDGIVEAFRALANRDTAAIDAP